MSAKKIKVNENIENLCPIAKKRTNAKSATFTTAKFLNCESASSPSILSSELLEEMGIGMLDSEESSSSVVSAIALAVSSTTTSDENSNESTPNINGPKIQHQHISYISGNVTADTTFEALTDTENATSTSIESHLNEQHLQKQPKLTADKMQGQHKKVAFMSTDSVTGNITGYNISSSNSPTTHKRTRNPLSTVSCNTRHDKSIILPPPSQQQQQVIANTSPLNVMPSTSKQAMILKSQAHLNTTTQYQKQTRPHHEFFVPNEAFFLYRTPQMAAHLADGTNYFEKLSDEMILYIFQYLPKKTLLRLSTVCRRFNSCAKDESLWLRLEFGGRSLRPCALEHIISRGVVILRLAQSLIHEPAFSEHATLNKQKIRLQYLDLSLVTISKPSLKIFLSHCRYLKKLSLEHCELNHEICLEIARNKNLEAINLAMCNGLQANSVHIISDSLKNLNSLNISWTGLNVDAVTALVANVTPNLIRLNVAGCRKTMFDTHVATLSKRCTQLIELDLSDCSSLTSNVIGILCKFKMLEYLSVSRCYLIPASKLLELKNLSTLQYLDVFGMMSDQAMELLSKNLPKMGINKFIHSSVARPTVGTRRTSIWGLRTRDF